MRDNSSYQKTRTWLITYIIVDHLPIKQELKDAYVWTVEDVNSPLFNGLHLAYATLNAQAGPNNGHRASLIPPRSAMISDGHRWSATLRRTLHGHETAHDTRKGHVWPICLVKKINKSIDRSKASVHRQETGIKARCLVRSSETKGGGCGVAAGNARHAPGRGLCSPARVIPGGLRSSAQTRRPRCYQLFGLVVLRYAWYDTMTIRCTSLFYEAKALDIKLLTLGTW